MSDKLTTLAELTAAASRDSQARNRLTYLFDEGKFTELDPYAMSGDDLSGVITAFGYVDQNPVYAFSQDISVKKGAMTEAHAKKISKVYSLAAKTGVPVVGIYDSFGADVTDPSSALTAYGYLLSKVANLSGVVPQIAVVAGTCAGCAAMLAESADLTVITKQGELYVAPNADIKDLAENAVKNGTACALCEDDKQACEFAGELIAKLPQNNLSPVPMYEFEEPAFTGADNAQNTVDSIFDADSAAELYAGFGKASYTALATLGGATVGVVATNKTEDKLTSADCSKIARFVRLCDSFAVPVDAEGIYMIIGRQSCDTRKLEGSTMDVGNSEFGGVEALTIFDNVFVPNDRIFMNGEYEFAGMLVEQFAGYHRQSYGGCKVGVGDVLIGAAAVIADYNGCPKASHIKDKIIEMQHLNETLYCCGIACSAEGQPTAAGNYTINLLLANVCKQNVTRFPYEIVRLAEDIAGGLMVTAPSEKDFRDAKLGPYVEKYLRGSSEVSTENRLRMLRLIENLSLGTAAVGYRTESMHGAGSPQAQRIMIARQGNLAMKKKLAKDIAHIVED